MHKTERAVYDPDNHHSKNNPDNTTTRILTSSFRNWVPSEGQVGLEELKYKQNVYIYMKINVVCCVGRVEIQIEI